MLRKLLYRFIFLLLGVSRLYRRIVIGERHQGIRSLIRADLTRLLESINARNPHFRGRYAEFLSEVEGVDDDAFFKAFARLPAMTKQDYAAAGLAVMDQEFAESDPGNRELKFSGRPLSSLLRLRKGNYLMPMATGGSSALPLVVQMTKHHMFSMLFTFFKCWYRMGWRPGERMLVFYPKNTYNIDDMVKFNRFSWLTGFRYHLFDRIDLEAVRGLVDELNRYRPRLLLVFPSPMNMIAHTIRKHQLLLEHQPALINVSGETFFDCQRRNIESVFPRSKVEDSYGSVELGEIAHETANGLEVFADVAYVETEPNAAGQPEMVVTRLHLSDFPFIRYKMKDIARIEFQTDSLGREKFLLRQIEGKDSNFILSDSGQRFYPSFFNNMVNELNSLMGDSIVEIKVIEREQNHWEILLIARDGSDLERLERELLRLLRVRLSPNMNFDVRFVEFIDHDYRKKYRVIERGGEVEFAGGIVGDRQKLSTVRDVESASGLSEDLASSSP